MALGGEEREADQATDQWVELVTQRLESRYQQSKRKHRTLPGNAKPADAGPAQIWRRGAAPPPWPRCQSGIRSSSETGNEPSTALTGRVRSASVSRVAPVNMSRNRRPAEEG